MPHSPNEPYMAILSVGADEKVTKYMNFATSAEANAHIVKFQGQYPKAFVHENPGNWCQKHTYVDMDAKTFNFDVQEDLDASAMESWENQIAYTDGLMPRHMEDLITSNASLVIPAEMKKRYDDKIKVRGERP